MNSIVQTAPNQFKEIVQGLYDEAVRDKPKELPDISLAPWVVRKMMANLERNTGFSRVLQVFIGSAAYRSQMWQMDMEEPQDFRDYLESIGSDKDGTRLSPSTISYITSTAEIIIPFCEANEIEVNDLIGNNWSKFREAIPALRKAITKSDDPVTSVSNIVNKVEALPNSSSVREAYAKPRGEKSITGDFAKDGDTIVVVLKIDYEDWPAIKGQLARKTTWKTMITRKDGALVLAPTNNE